MNKLNIEIPYIENLPKSWRIIPNRYLFIENKNSVGKDFSKYQLLSLTTTGVKEKDINSSGGKVPESYEKYLSINKNQLIFCLFDLDLSAVFSGISKFDGMITSAYNAYDSTSLICNEYADYWFQYVFTNRYYMIYSKNIRYSVTGQAFKAIYTPVPPINTQKEIALFLDNKTNKIDQLINNQQQQIEKLKEYKQSLISEVVTKGLDPNVEFKDSGIEIIDKIPKDWGIIKMKYLGESRNGLTYNPSDMVDDGEGILVLRSSNVRDGKLIFDDNVYLKMQIKEDLMLKNGDILICSRNGSRDLIGKNAIIENVGLCSFGAFMMVFRVSKANPKYIKYILDSFIFNYYLGTYLTATINQLTLSNFNNMKVIYTTNSDEQEKIISYLDEKCQKIDQLIELKAKKLLNLEEFKKSLIYEYVTGKKEVS
ncbi:Restriction endonuclease S subunit [Paracholeplasma brassicae]|uniref:Restriction endonuclease S subunit n=1 Tax=Acholeplasma brassicae TaxID=61635 RepID=U4KMT7_9MOLU|nr:restriction endonuclease subunit S [Paracholeplasma brassicae]CCV65547.1 Restriction endonuclease S subunit [Paracholeplasma brassicae]